MLPAAAAALAAFLVLRTALAPLGLLGAALSEWVGLLGTGWWVLRRRGENLASAVRLVPVPLQGWTAAILLAGAGLPLAWAVTWLQSPLIRPDPRVLEALGEGLVPGSPLEAAALFAVAALTPAICEEVVFRGLLLQGLRDRMSDTGAIVASALVFGAIHWIPGTAFRILPLATVGLLLGWTVIRSGSLIPAMVLHALHNGGILLASVLGAGEGESAAGAAVSQAPPAPFLLLGVAFLALGAQLLPPAGPEPTTST